MKKFDAIIIGSGQAGPALAVKLAAAGMETVLIEREHFGGTCVNDGCTPTKTLIASAKAAFTARRSADFGVMIDGAITVDMKKVKARKDALVEESRSYIESLLRNTKHCTAILGNAHFTGPRTVQVGDDHLEADKIFINVGGKPVVPSGFVGVEHFTNTTIMDVDFVPEHLIIVGGSYIGLEFGQMYRRFGSEVTIIERNPTVINREDPDVADEIRKILAREGIRFRFDADCMQARSGEKGNIIVDIECASGERTVEGSHLLLAVGRKPNTDTLGLEAAGVATDSRGFIIVDNQLRTNVEGIWALGDCNGKGSFTHTAYNDYEIVAANILGNDPRSVTDRITCYGLFTDPPLARVGMSEKEVRASGRKALIASRTMKIIARAKEKGETNGFMKILVDAETKKILGATIIGVEGDEVIHSMLDIMYADAPYTVIQRAVHIHPTVSELIPTTLADLIPLV
jgi:pyruvate/2-oxoglutarate dehydrogenase complex dihydrolipoamide dehydrogenase (E3) component